MGETIAEAGWRRQDERCRAGCLAAEQISPATGAQAFAYIITGSVS